MELRGHRVLELRFDPLREHGDDRHEREPDHQRGGGRRSPSGISHRVRTGEGAGDAADQLGGTAEDRGERTGNARRHHRDTDEEAEDADAEQDQAVPGRESAPERAEENHCERDSADDKCDHRPEAGEPRRRQDRAFAHGRDRRHAGRPDGRPQACEERDDDPERHRDDHRAPREHEPPLRQVGPERLEEGVEPLGEREPDEQADERCERPEHEPFDDHRRAVPDDLLRPPRGASRTRACAGRS